MIFISHSTKNEDVAKEIRDELEKKHYKCFLSSDDLEADDDWHDEIWKALIGSHAFLGIVTKEFYESAFCQQELGAALAFPNKPRLLILHDATKPPGFAARFQACKRSKLFVTLDTKPRYRTVRVEAWITAARSVTSYKNANEAHDRFSGEWDSMSQDEKLRWLLAAAGNSQVRGEGFKAGPFFQQAKKDLKKLLTDQWLFENDKEGYLHDVDSNPVGKAASSKKKTAKKTKRRPRDSVRTPLP